MRIAFINSLYPPWGAGGAETTLQGLAEGLTARGAEVVVYSLSPEGKASSGEVNGVRVHYLKARTAMWPWASESPAWRRVVFQLQEVYNRRAERDLHHLLAIERPDVVHVHNFKGFSAVAVWRAARRLGIPLVQTLHDYTLVCPRSVMLKAGVNCRRQCPSCRLLSAPRRRLAGLPDLYTAVSHRMVQRMENCGVRWRASPEIIRGDNPVRSSAKHEPTAAASVFGFLGRLDPTKGVEVLLEAARLYRGPACRILIAGSGPAAYLDALKARAPPDVAVEFVGWAVPADFFATIHVLVAPSVWEEPLGRVVHEAFGFGVPVIASAGGGIPEIVRTEVDGLLVSPGHPEQLARAMERLATDQRFFATLSRGAALAARAFDRDVIHLQYLDALRRVIG